MSHLSQRWFGTHVFIVDCVREQRNDLSTFAELHGGCMVVACMAHRAHPLIAKAVPLPCNLGPVYLPVLDAYVCLRLQ